MPGVHHSAHALAKLPQLAGPGIVKSISAKRLLERFPSSTASGTDGCHRTTVADYDIRLPVTLYVVQNLGEPARSIGGTELLHEIRLSDYTGRAGDKV